ncbi:hypothetical protein [Streptomyces sp. NPDC057438]|uniref:Rv1733c family protein n=1 Tax=Streptomyces sp. NPDC057438 TaxID=3346133 RepID=UPI0036A60015
MQYGSFVALGYGGPGYRLRSGAEPPKAGREGAAHAADESFAQLRRERHSVPAVLVEGTAEAVPTAKGAASERVRAQVRWMASDGSTRTGRTLVDSEHQAGSKVVIWLNSRGQLTTEPLTAGAAAFEAALFGTGAALTFSGLTYATGRLAQ